MADEKAQGIEVKSQEYGGAPIEHPSIVDATRNLIRQGKDNRYIARVVGIPDEVINSHRKAMEGERR